MLFINHSCDPGTWASPATSSLSRCGHPARRGTDDRRRPVRRLKTGSMPCQCGTAAVPRRDRGHDWRQRTSSASTAATSPGTSSAASRTSERASGRSAERCRWPIGHLLWRWMVHRPPCWRCPGGPARPASRHHGDRGQRDGDRDPLQESRRCRGCGGREEDGEGDGRAIPLASGSGTRDARRGSRRSGGPGAAARAPDPGRGRG